MGKPQSTGNLVNALAQDSSNNIGIGGAANASFKLQVTGTTNLTGALSGTSATFSDIVTNTTGGIRTASSLGFILRNDVNNANLGGFTRRSYWAGGAALDTQIFAETGYGIFLNVDGGTSKGMTITSGGNVGIGMSDPQAPLHIIKALGSNVFAIGESGTNTRFAIGQEASYTGNYINSTNIDLKIQSYLSGGSGGTIIFQTGASGSGSLTERMRITSGGKVGISSSVAADVLLNVVNSSSTGFGMNISAASSSSQYALRVESYNGGVEFFRIRGDGNLGIGTSGATDVRLFVKSAGSGAGTYNIYSRDVNNVDLFVIRDDGYGYLKAAAWAYGSDRRIKENINYIESGLDKVLSLKPAIFDYIDGVKNNIGWIAQDVQEVIPQAVNVISEDNDQLTLKSDFIVPYLVKAIQEQQAQIEELKALIAAK